MLPTKNKLPMAYRLLNFLGESVEKFGLPMFRLDKEVILDSINRKTGFLDDGNDGFSPGLEKLLDSLKEDANLLFFGRLMAHWMLNIYISQRLLFTHFQNNLPDLFSTPLNAPIFITGLPRSGTTFLHRMIALDPNHYGIPLWKMLRPFNQPGAIDLRRIKASWELMNCQQFFHGIKQKHFLRIDEPEEDIWMMGLTLQSPIFWILMPVASYMEWLLGQDRSQCYREYTELLKAQQNKQPGKRLVLKAPDHMAHLDLLISNVPNARIIQLHRDPVECVISLSSLVYSTQSASSRGINPTRLVEVNCRMVKHYLRSNEQLRKNPAISNKILDIQYEELIQSPLAVVKRIYDFCEIPWLDDTNTALQRFVIDQPKNKFGEHLYHPEQFGLSSSDLSRCFEDL
jgi:hypothetical protein